MPLILGVTGSIAAGKSHLRRHLVARFGARYVDADEVVHAMYAPGTPGFDRVVAEFGTGIVGPDGTIERAILGALVFGQPDRMRELNKAIGDISAGIRPIVERWRATLPPDGIGIVEAIYLIEEGYASWCDATWLVAADETFALPRLMARNGLTEDQARTRLCAATPWHDRVPAYDRLLFNDDTTVAFETKIDVAINELLDLHRADALPPSRWHAWHEETRIEG